MRKLKGTTNKKQSKLVKYICTPLRILKKARELYMKGMQDCAGGLGGAYGGVEPYYSTLKTPHLPQTDHRGKPSRRTSGSNGTNYEPLLMIKLLMKEKDNSYNNNIDVVGGNKEERSLVLYREKQQNGGGYESYDYRIMRKSFSVGMRKMERIDEDRPCYFDEEEDQMDDLRTHMRKQKFTRYEKKKRTLKSSVKVSKKCEVAGKSESSGRSRATASACSGSFNSDQKPLLWFLSIS
ncbi:hypothetical protein G2W53_003017 [Senna tora]|uniref:Uncharacterized protein n=1 Tax=Senna tora TaxID=362788 RepID=A0A835CFX4_9FABA|nr:hypothetical protein G2W53_003017 [Senna tora]